MHQTDDTSPDLTDLTLRPLQISLLNKLHKNYGLTGKTILEIGSDLGLRVAQGMLRYGAKEVWAINPAFSQSPPPHVPGIITQAQPMEHAELPPGAFDVVFGMALLEHILYPAKLAEACKAVLSPNGVCYLQGSPTWTGAQGHHVFITGSVPRKSKFSFTDDSTPFENWEHLSITNGQELLLSLKKNGIPDSLFNTLRDALFFDTTISRLPPSRIIQEFSQVDGVKIDTYCYKPDIPKNQYYEKAKRLYKEDDLISNDVTIIMRHDHE